jgi:hypothetical protein
MNTTAIKNLTVSLRQISTDLKRLRAAEQILQGYVRLNPSGDGIGRAIDELQTAATQLVTDSRAFVKLVQDLAASVASSQQNAISPDGEEG